YTLFLTPTEAGFTLMGRAVGGRQKTGDTRDARHPTPSRAAVLRMELAGANPATRIAGIAPLAGKSHYFRGNDPARWRTHVETYGKVRYRNIYDGIDLLYYGNQRRLEYDFVVAPGATTKAIRLAFDGAQHARVDGNGDLILRLNGGDVRWHKPVLYQEVNGKRRSVGGRY